MEDLRLRFSHQPQTELALGAGVHAIGRIDGNRETLGVLAASAATASMVSFCVDRRGVWLRVAEGARGVHVNGREVRRMAMLRVGDAIYVDGVEMRLVSARALEVPGSAIDLAPSDQPGDQRVVLRGVGGQYHGRSFTLERPRLIGRHADADIRIDEPAFADRHARLELIGEQIVLRDLGSVDGSVVNGEQVRDALLQSGDQIVFDAHHRFVVEAPARAARPPELATEALQPALLPVDEDSLPREPRSPARRLPWLLLAALMLAAMLSALLLFGSA